MRKLENKVQKASRNQESEEWLECSVGDLTLLGTSAATGGGF